MCEARNQEASGSERCNTAGSCTKINSNGARQPTDVGSFFWPIAPVLRSRPSGGGLAVQAKPIYSTWSTWRFQHTLSIRPSVRILSLRWVTLMAREHRHSQKLTAMHTGDQLAVGGPAKSIPPTEFERCFCCMYWQASSPVVSQAGSTASVFEDCAMLRRRTGSSAGTLAHRSLATTTESRATILPLYDTIIPGVASWKRIYPFVFTNPVMLTVAILLTARRQFAVLGRRAFCHAGVRLANMESFLLHRTNGALQDPVRGIAKQMLVAVAMYAPLHTRSSMAMAHATASTGTVCCR